MKSLPCIIQTHDNVPKSDGIFQTEARRSPEQHFNAEIAWGQTKQKATSIINNIKAKHPLIWCTLWGVSNSVDTYQPQKRQHHPQTDKDSQNKVCR